MQVPPLFQALAAQSQALVLSLRAESLPLHVVHRRALVQPLHLVSQANVKKMIFFVYNIE